MRTVEKEIEKYYRMKGVYVLRIEELTDVGRVRQINEDNCTSFSKSGYSLAIVADGMGGHLAGEIASKMAVDIISKYIKKHLTPDLDRFQVKELANKAFKEANREIYKYSCDNESVMGMGTTTTMCIIRDNTLIYAHVGDSRAYMIGKGIEQITNDHSYVQELVKLGQITPDEAKHHPRRNYITRAMGVEESVRVDTGIKPYNGESVLICSDGLHGEIEDKEMLDIIKNNKLKDSVKALVNLANERGGSDNITAVVMEGEKS